MTAHSPATEWRVWVVVTHVLLEADQGAAESTWRQTNRAHGSRQTVEDAIILEFRDDKLVSPVTRRSPASRWRRQPS